jgi:Fe-S cluster assembly iron-binding protein IscA
MKKSYLNSERNTTLSLKPSKAIRLLLMVLFICLFGNKTFAQTIDILNPGETSWTVPCGITSITVEVWGAGGAGGGSSANNVKGCGGGAGGSYAKSIISVSSNQVIPYSVGSGANGTTTSGVSGEGSWFLNTNTVYAQGGAGGAAPNGSTANGGNGSISSSFGSILSVGQNGQNGTSSIGGAGGDGSNPSGGNGGASRNNNNNGGDGRSGSSTGGGGGGAYVGDSQNRVGGDGGNGQIKITYTLPVIDAPASVTPNSNTTICDGSSLTLNATSTGNTIYWFDQQNGGISIGSSPSGENFTFIPTKQSTRYYAEAISPGGCSSSSRSRTNTITLTNPPTITTQPTAPASICAGNSLTLSVNATPNNLNYQWRKDGVNISNTNSSTYTIANPTTSLNGSVFDVVVSRSGCSVVSDPVSFTVNPSPSANITGASGICAGSSTSLTAATPGGTWSSSNTRATVDPNGVVTGVSTGNFTITYSVTSNGCTVTSTKAMTVSSAPTPVVSFTQGNLDSNLSITACQEVGGGGQNDLDILSGNPNGSTYQWQVSYDNGLSWENASGPTNIQNQYVLDPFYTVFTSNSGTYKFRLLIDNNGCSGVSNLLTLTVSGTSALTAGTIVGNQSSCGQSLDPAGFTSSAAAGGMSPPNYTYQWQSSIDGVNFTNIANNATSTTYNSPAINQTTYFRRSVRSGGCSAFSNVLSVLVGAPVANVSQPSCTSSTGTVTVPFPASGITYTITGTSPVVATVTNTTGIFSGLTPGDYEVRFIAAAACVSLPTSVTVNERPLVPTMPVTKTAQPCGVPTGTITVTPQNAGETYSFDNGATFQSSNIKSGLTPGNYYVIIKNLVCNSPSKLTVINTSPTTPSTPVIASVIHPICAVSSGTITVTVQNTGELYSFDNGVTFQSSNIKSGLTAGSYNVIIQSAGGCNSTLKQVTINVQPLVPLAPSVTETVPTCALQTGTITITQVGTETYSFDGGTFSNILIYPGLAQGSLHTVRAMNAGGCISPTVNISITSLTNTWIVGVWSLGTPTAEQKLVFDDDYSENIDIVGCSCQVNAKPLAPFEVTITTGHTMTITNEVSVDVDGFLTFEDDASLVQINNTTNTGEIDYIRTTDTGIYKTDYVYWSSPVEGFTLGDVSKNLTLSDKYYSYEPTATGEDWQQESTSTEMLSGKGYIIRGPEYGPSAQPGNKYTATFTGVPNNGHYEINELFADKSYLLGNPYPSALDADTFLANNAGVLNGTLYFWTHNTDMQNRNLILSTAGSGAYAYTSNDYATYNATGGVGIDSGTVTAPATIGTNPRGDNNANPPSGKIASGQGFFASTKTGLTDSKIIFDNTMRVGVSGITGNNTQFFKTRNSNGKTANTKVIEKNRVWLNLTNVEGAFKQTLVGYLTEATNDYDDRFDGESFDGNEFIDFYSLNQEINLTIQGRSLPFDENDEVPLGYRTIINGTFTINIAQVDGLLTNQAVFIEDKLTNTVFDLKQGNYTFNTVAGTFNDRFVLKYSNKTLKTNTFGSLGKTVLVSNKNKQIKIDSSIEMIDKVAIYDLLGRQTYQKTNVNSNELSISNLVSNRQMLMVKTTLQNGETVTKKIIY